MATYKFIVLDSYPLGNSAISLTEARAGLTEGGRCRQWMMNCEAAGNKQNSPVPKLLF